MSVAFDNGTSGGNVLSFSFTTGSGANRYLVIGVAIASRTISVATATYNSVSAGLLGRQAHPTAAESCEMWGLVAPTSGAHTVLITLSGSNPGVGLGACSFTGVDQSTPTDGNALGNTGTSVRDPVSQAKTGALGDMLCDVVVSDKGVSAVGGIAAWNDAAGDAQSYLAANGGSQTCGWSTALVGDWAEVVALLKTASAAPPDIPPVPVISSSLAWGGT